MIRFQTLGTLEVTLDGAEPPSQLLWKKNFALLLYLARAPKRRCTREELIERCVRRYRVPIQLGTKHENAEAYLYLVDWLDKKLHNPQKRAQYGLSPRDTRG